MTAFTFNTAKSLCFGAGSLSEIGAIAQSTIGTRTLVVTDPGLQATGIVAEEIPRAGVSQQPRPPRAVGLLHRERALASPHQNALRHA